MLCVYSIDAVCVYLYILKLKQHPMTTATANKEWWAFTTCRKTASTFFFLLLFVLVHQTIETFFVFVFLNVEWLLGLSIPLYSNKINNFRHRTHTKNINHQLFAWGVKWRSGFIDKNAVQHSWAALKAEANSV